MSSVIAAAGGAETDAETTVLSSINRVTGGNAIQLLDFDKNSTTTWQQISAYGNSLVFREHLSADGTMKIDYLSLKDLMDNYIWKEYIGDSQNQNLA